MINLSLLMWLYGRGLIQMRAAMRGNHRSSGRFWLRKPLARKAPASGRIAPHSTLAFAVGLCLLALCLLSPIDLLGEQLSWVHMIQHMLIMTVAVPLMLLGSPGLILMRGLPAFSRRWVGRGIRWLDRSFGSWLWSAGLAWSVYAVATWAWHIPALYGAALRLPLAHDLQHLSFFVAAWLFWKPLLNSSRRNTLPAGLAVLYLLTTTLHMTVLGVLMTVAPTAWYGEYATTTQLWGWSPLEDQQMAGLIMWMPACLPYLLAAVWIFAGSIWQTETRPLARGLPSTSSTVT